MHSLSHRDLASLAHIVSYLTGKFPGIRVSVQGGVLEYQITLHSEYTWEIEAGDKWLADFLLINKED